MQKSTLIFYIMVILRRLSRLGSSSAKYMPITNPCPVSLQHHLVSQSDPQLNTKIVMMKRVMNKSL